LLGQRHPRFLPCRVRRRQFVAWLLLPLSRSLAKALLRASHRSDVSRRHSRGSPRGARGNAAPGASSQTPSGSCALSRRAKGQRAGARGIFHSARMQTSQRADVIPDDAPCGKGWSPRAPPPWLAERGCRHSPLSFPDLRCRPPCASFPYVLSRSGRKRVSPQSGRLRRLAAAQDLGPRQDPPLALHNARTRAPLAMQP